MTWGPMGRGGDCPSCKKLKADNKKLRAQLAACAAGPWQTDVELRKAGEARELGLYAAGCEYYEDLAAANATLDALREAVPEDDEIYGWSERAYLKLLLEIQRQLYPQPKETTHDDE